MQLLLWADCTAGSVVSNIVCFFQNGCYGLTKPTLLILTIKRPKPTIGLPVNNFSLSQKRLKSVFLRHKYFLKIITSPGQNKGGSTLF